MIPEKLSQVLQHEGVVAIVTQGEDGPHVVNTWNSYIQVTSEDSLLIPAGFMHKTEKNITINPDVLVTAGAREVEGNHGPGTGFLIKGTAAFRKEGSEFELIRGKFPWARAALEIKIASATQTL
ncbi:MAG TPA: pyridoxamine 5'-phosphate oxidase family protein [Bacillota bacterium]|nr:pyridoxamine 5'-phosphate oxidase family protein [Bacillota bacterium]